MFAIEYNNKTLEDLQDDNIPRETAMEDNTTLMCSRYGRYSKDKEMGGDAS